jgi:hypothetical protein
MTTPFVPHLTWAKGGSARFESVTGETVVLRSTTPAPPGARLEGTLDDASDPATVKVKSHGSRREEDGTFVIKGRLVDATRTLRERVTALVSAPLTG